MLYHANCKGVRGKPTLTNLWAMSSTMAFDSANLVEFSMWVAKSSRYFLYVTRFPSTRYPRFSAILTAYLSSGHLVVAILVLK